MKLYRKSLLLLGSLSAFGWFILRDISFCAALFLIPMGVLFYFLHRLENGRLWWLNGITASACILIASSVVSVGLFEGLGFGMALFLIMTVALSASFLRKNEWARISGWWMCAFMIVFVLMFIATLSGFRFALDYDKEINFRDVLIFYLLAFLEPLSMGREYRASPLSLGIVLAPFGIAAYFSLGAEAFYQAEFAYLSVWSGVSLSAFHHLEGFILSLYFGAVIFRSAYAVREIVAVFKKPKNKVA